MTNERVRNMNGEKIFQLVIWKIMITLLVGCGVAADLPVPEIEVIFEGNGCTASGPTRLPTGDHSFAYKNLSEDNIDLWVGRILDGKTYQDMLNLQSEPGEFIPQPSWTVHQRQLGKAWNESIGGEIYTFDLNNEGEHYIVVGSYSPKSVWFCGSFQVIEAPSE